MPRALNRITFGMTAVLTLAACAGAPNGSVTRNADALHLASLPIAKQEEAVTRQADVLTARTAEILRKATLRGAGFGAAAGCGVGLATGQGASRCLGGALAGGALGAAVGHAQGQAEVKKRVEIIDPSPLVAGMSKANAAVEALGKDVPALIAVQDTELRRLKSDHNAGTISTQAYVARLSEITTVRQRLASSLELSQKQAVETADALEAAQKEGQTGLDWHLHQAQRIGREATSARSAITLL